MNEEYLDEELMSPMDRFWLKVKKSFKKTIIEPANEEDEFWDIEEKEKVSE